MQIVERVIQLVAPHVCLQCGHEGALLCDWCLPDALSPLPERCYKCNKASPDSAVCAACRRITKLRHAWIRTAYEEVAKDVMYRFKFNRAQAAALPVAQLMCEAIPWLPTGTLVVHVPTASSRRRGRGYDHAELLAKQIAQRRGLLHSSLLGRLGQTRQVGAKREQRLTQLGSAFYPRHQRLIPGSHILLVDDILTTGGSLEAAAAVLKKAGAKTVDAVVFAQKQ